MERRKKAAQIWPGSQEFAKKFAVIGRDSRTYKTNPGGSPVGNQLELTQTLLSYHFSIYDLKHIL